MRAGMPERQTALPLAVDVIAPDSLATGLLLAAGPHVEGGAAVTNKAEAVARFTVRSFGRIAVSHMGVAAPALPSCSLVVEGGAGLGQWSTSRPTRSAAPVLIDTRINVALRTPPAAHFPISLSTAARTAAAARSHSGRANS